MATLQERLTSAFQTVAADIKALRVGKADLSHVHAISEVTSLQGELNSRFKDVTLTQVQYDALATKDPNTLYVITG